MKFASIRKTDINKFDCFVRFGIDVYERAVNYTVGKMKWEVDNLTASEVEQVVVNIYDAEKEVLVSEIVLKRSPVSSGKFIIDEKDYGLSLMHRLSEYEQDNF